MRSLSRLILAGWLCVAGAVVAYSPPSYAQGDGSEEANPPSVPIDGSDAESPPPAEAPVVPVGPNLQAADQAPVVCDGGTSRLRFVEVRGTGFDAWASQRLVGNVVDGNGLSQMQWGSVWVTPDGRLTLEVNVCADPFRNRPALPVGSYTVTVGPDGGRPIAATSIALAPQPEPLAEGDQPESESMPAAADLPAATDTSSPLPTLAPLVLPQLAPTPTPLPQPTTALAEVAAAPTPGPRTGPGSASQPFPLGAPGTLVDGWQLVVTGVTPDAWSGIHNDVPSTVAPAADQRDYMVRVQATFVGQGTGVFSGMRLALLSGSQTIYDQLHNACGTVPDMVPPNLMTPGGSTRGNVCFTVRATDINSLTLFDNQSTEADRLYFALK